jgi:dihydroneopterin aldolase
MHLVSSNIELKNLRFHAYHGVSKEEQQTGSDFAVQLKLFFVPLPVAMEGDELRGTVNYAEVYETVKNEMAHKSQLIENVAWRVAQALFQRFAIIDAIEICVEKENPPISADCQSAAVLLKFERENGKTKD